MALYKKSSRLRLRHTARTVQLSSRLFPPILRWRPRDPSSASSTGSQHIRKSRDECWSTIGRTHLYRNTIPRDFCGYFTYGHPCAFSHNLDTDWDNDVTKDKPGSFLHTHFHLVFYREVPFLASNLQRSNPYHRNHNTCGLDKTTKHEIIIGVRLWVFLLPNLALPE
jgi:hypothetical protein